MVDPEVWVLGSRFWRLTSELVLPCTVKLAVLSNQCIQSKTISFRCCRLSVVRFNSVVASREDPEGWNVAGNDDHFGRFVRDKSNKRSRAITGLCDLVTACIICAPSSIEQQLLLFESKL